MRIRTSSYDDLSCVQAELIRSCRLGLDKLEFLQTVLRPQDEGTKAITVSMVMPGSAADKVRTSFCTPVRV